MHDRHDNIVCETEPAAPDVLHEMVNSRPTVWTSSSSSALLRYCICRVIAGIFCAYFYCVIYDCKKLINSSVVVFCLHQAKMALKWWLNNFFKGEPGCKTQDKKGCTLSPVAKGSP